MVFVGEQNTPKIKLSVTASVIILVLIAIALTFTTFAAITTSQSLSSSGQVTTSANLGVYSNSACTTSLSSINWGTLTAGGNITRTVYIKNTGSGLALTLSMETSNWTPAGAERTYNPDMEPRRHKTSTRAVCCSNLDPFGISNHS